MEFMPKHDTYNYLKKLYSTGNRVIISRYGDGEYFIIQGLKEKVSRQDITPELSELMIRSAKTKGQLICLPAKIKINAENLYLVKNINLSDFLSRYIVAITNHELYGQGQWRMIDLLNNKSEFITNFFIDETLIITPHIRTSKIAFEKMNNIKMFEVPISNACGDYKNIKNKLISVCNRYRNIIFACGPLSNILIADLIECCDSHLIDLGSVIGIIINPYSVDIPVARRWSGFGKKGDPKVVERCSIDFFDTLNMKLEKI